MFVCQVMLLMHVVLAHFRGSFLGCFFDKHGQSMDIALRLMLPNLHLRDSRQKCDGESLSLNTLRAP